MVARVITVVIPTSIGMVITLFTVIRVVMVIRVIWAIRMVCVN